MTKFFMWLAWIVPRPLAYWCAVRVMGHASVVYAGTQVNAITPVMVLEAWEESAA